MHHELSPRDIKGLVYTKLNLRYNVLNNTLTTKHQIIAMSKTMKEVIVHGEPFHAEIKESPIP